MAALFPLAFITTVAITSGITHDVLGIGKDYQSEWFDNDGWWLSMILAIVFSCFVCLLSLPIFLTNNYRVRANKYLTMIAWFAAPGSLIVYIFAKHIQYLIRYDNGSLDENIFVFTILLPHLIGLTVAYIKFKRKESIGKTTA